MEQTVYTQVSKHIGITGQAIHLPPMEIAKELLTDTKAGNIGAFEAVFRYYRFSHTPVSDPEREVLDIITQAYNIGSEIFKNKTS